MEEQFYEKYDHHEFKMIYDTIASYYPIGKSLSKEDYNNYPGILEIGNIVNKNFFEKKNYKDRWVNLRRSIKQVLGKPVNETMVPFYPCYSGNIILEKKKYPDYTRTKRLQFYISLLGPYYSIFGVDESEIKLEYEEKLFEERKGIMTYPAIHAITVSPYVEFEESFLSLENIIKEYFPTSRIIPHQIHQMQISSSSYPFTQIIDKGHDSIFSALFNPDIMFCAEIRGDEHYGFDEWLTVKKLEASRIEAIRERLLRHSAINKGIDTIHKVWKLKKMTVLPNHPIKGMFGMDVPKVFDLTEINQAFIIVEENKEPIISACTVTEEKLIIQSLEKVFTYRISNLSSDQLVLVVHVEINLDGYKVDGDVAEMILEPYS